MVVKSAHAEGVLTCKMNLYTRYIQKNRKRKEVDKNEKWSGKNHWYRTK